MDLSDTSVGILSINIYKQYLFFTFKYYINVYNI